jgi:tRNA (guanosine-2'-O-)-methyltransferase
VRFKDQQLLNYLSQFITEERKLKFEQVLTQRTKHFTVVLENIYQPHNSNAVMRSCDCFGFHDCHLIEEIYKFSPSIGVSSGAVKWLDIYRNETSLQAINTLKEQGYQIVATSPHEENCNLEDFDISKKSAFFFGAEKKGLSDTVIKAADSFLKIPMYGHTESLNISVSAAIILQNLSTRLRSSNISWQLEAKTKDLLKLEWFKKSTKNLEVHLRNFEAMSNKNS